MPVTFRQIAAKEAKVTLQVGDDTVTIVYYPNKLTEKMIAQIEEGVTKDNDLLAELIKSWDVYEDDEHTVMFPLDRINEFGLQFKQQIAVAIGEAMRPNTVPTQMNGNGSKLI